MRKRIKKKKNMIIGGLLAVVFLMSVGYAAFASQLSISGTANTSSWIIKITNIREKTKTAGVTNKGTNYTDLTANFNCELTLPGDSITYEVTVENQGNIDASLKEVTKSFTNDKYIDVTYSGLYEGQMLYKQGAENSTAVMEVTVTFKDLDYEGTFTDTITSNISLNLNFEQEGNNVDTTKKYLVTYDSNGGTPVESRYFGWNDKCVGDEAYPKKVGYDFAAWFAPDSDEGSGMRADCYVSISQLLENENLSGITLWADYSEKTYSIIFDTQGGNSISSTHAQWNQYVFAVNQPTRKGYIFDGWYTQPNGKGMKLETMTKVSDVVQKQYGEYNDVAGGENGDEVTLYANWIAKEYTVIYNSHGGTEVNIEQTYKWLDKIILPEPPTREGYTFKNWQTMAPNSSGKAPFGSKVVTENLSLSSIRSTDSNANPITLHAYWTENS